LIDGEFVDGVFERPVPPMLRPHCGIWAEPGRVEVMFSIDPKGISYQHIVVEVPQDGLPPIVNGRGSESIPTFATVAQAARLYGFKPKTLYNWIESGKLRKEHGLLRLGRECRIELRTFKAAIDRGEVGACS
jgi:hypothetical protein